MWKNRRQGFTLIELSIVLVIIGLIVGGVLVGRDLIEAAEVRRLFAQLGKYRTAMNAFRLKYNALPGDMAATQATQLGFIARAGGVCDGDGDGYICGLTSPGFPTETDSGTVLGGETVFFWTDLSSAQLIEGRFSDSSDTYINVPPGYTGGWRPYLPAAKTGNNGFFTVFGNRNDGQGFLGGYGGLVFELAALWGTNSPTNGGMGINYGALRQTQAYSIDSKMDDGLPASGAVQVALGSNGVFVGGGSIGLSATFSGINNGLTQDYCMSTAPYSYNAQFHVPACNLMFRGE